jgi:putative ABC transport system substrate-binding protein
VRRREFLAGVLAATTPVVLRAAEPDTVYRLAVCSQFGMDSFSNSFWRRLFNRLRQVGYTEGKNLIVDRYATQGRSERYAEIARNMVQAKPDVIALGFDHQFIAQVAKETSTIPIVAAMGDPVAAGLVQNMARPERNITGVALDAGIEMQGKHLDILRQAAPLVSRVAYLSNRVEWEGAWGHAALAAGRQLGVSIIGIPMERSAGEPEYREAFETMARQSADGLMFNGFSPNFDNRELIAELALKYRLPSICWWPELVEKGPAFLAYAPDYDFYLLHWADEVAQILKGAAPSDIPIPQPTKLILAISLKAAKVLGLTVPSTFLVSADEVIE